MAKLPLACKICRDVLRAYVRCFLVRGDRTGTTPTHSCWRDCWGRGAGGHNDEGCIQRGGEIQPDVFEVSGTVKWFDPSKGYGFIAPDEDLPDVLLHVTCLRRAGFESPSSATNKINDLWVFGHVAKWYLVTPALAAELAGEFTLRLSF